MSLLSPPSTNLHRSISATSVAASDTTYHSFHDIELFEPSATAGPIRVHSPLRKEHTFQPTPMQRQDSGYESITSGSKSGSSSGSNRRPATTTTKSSQARPRTRPSIHRATKSTPSPHVGYTPRHSLHQVRSLQQPNTFFHFPPPEVSLSADEDIHDTEPLYPPPPQTTHYWTSDHTRKLEYAAIDAASRGVKGWVLRHMVPNCFMPKEDRRVTFDDDTGSVRRYRLELEYEDGMEKSGGKKKMGWLFGR